MKRGILTGMAILGLLTMAGVASATPIADVNNGEQHLYQIYNATYGTSFVDSNALPQLSPDNPWITSGGGTLLVTFRYAGNSQGLGYRNPDNTNHLIVGGIPQGSTVQNIAFNPANPFQWVEYVGGLPTWYSDPALNGGEDHFVAFSTSDPTRFLIAFEDKAFTTEGQLFGVDYDYNDLVADVRVLPEPGTMILLGSGLLGLAGFARRRKS